MSHTMKFCIEKSLSHSFHRGWVEVSHEGGSSPFQAGTSKYFSDEQRKKPNFTSTKKKGSRLQGSVLQKSKIQENKTSWWLNHPIWKICSSTWESSPGKGEHKTYLKPPPRKQQFLLGFSEPTTYLVFLVGSFKSPSQQPQHERNPWKWKMHFRCSEYTGCRVSESEFFLQNLRILIHPRNSGRHVLKTTLRESMTQVLR